MRRDWIVDLSDRARAAPARVGGKAHNLAMLSGAGFLVPRGFCITTDAFRHYCRANRVLERSGAAEARQAILAGELPDDLREVILAARAGLSACVAVRSSATAEDRTEGSAAGQLDSFLGVTNDGELVDRIRACWASYFGERAREYFGGRAARDRPGMAVLVQDLVAADVAGVLFTANPVTGARDELLVDAHPGLGEPLVAGRVTPDHFVVSRSGSISLRERRIATKESALRLDAGALSEVPIEPHERDAPSLSDEQILRLARTGLEIERVFGREAQDVEWGFRGDELFVLQTRPVTGLPRKARIRTDKAWTNMNVGEAVPGVLDPLTFDFLERLLLDAIYATFESIGLKVDRGQSPVVSIRGRLYVDLVVTMSILSQIPGFSADHLRVLGGQFAELELAYPRRSRAGFLLRCPLRLPGFLARSAMLSRRLRLSAERIVRWSRSVAELDLSALGTAELGRKLDTYWPETRPLIECWLAASGNGEMLYVVLERLLARWLGEDGRLLNRLMTGITGLESTEPGVAMWEISRAVAASAELVSLFREIDTADRLRAELARRPDGRGVLRELDALLARFGHRCHNELDLMAEPWRADPSFVLQAIRTYCTLGDADGPASLERRQVADREEALEELRARLAAWKRPIVRSLLRQCWKYTRQREYGRFHMVLGVDAVRRIVVAAARRLAHEGRLASEADVFFLRWAELGDLLRGKTLDAAVARAIGERREEYRRNLRLPPLPGLLVGDWESAPEARARPDDRFLRGVPASSGVVTGTARVLLDPSESPRFSAGEILVTSYTDVSWTPLFVAAKGVVMDVGGVLSHAAVVAREYGIPAVVNVGHGTTLIRDGQEITVDADQGIVWVA